MRTHRLIVAELQRSLADGAAIAAAAIAAMAPIHAVHAQATLPCVFVGDTSAKQLISTYRPHIDGTLTLVSSIYSSIGGIQYLVVSPDGRHVLAVSQSHILVLSVDQDGNLFYNGLHFVFGPLRAAWLDDSHVVVSRVAPMEGIVALKFHHDARFGQLTEIGFLPNSTNTKGFARNPVSGTLYATNGDTLRGYRVQPGGVTSQIQSGGPWEMSELAVSLDGSRLYTASWASPFAPSTVYGMTIDESGLFTLIPSSPYSFADSGSWHVAINDSATFVLSGYFAGSMESLAIDPVTGALSPAGFSFDLSSPFPMGDVATLGDLVFVTDFHFSRDDDETYGIYSLHLGPRGELVQAGPIELTPGSRPYALAVWTPPSNPADLNGDGEVTGLDLAQLLAAWGPCPPEGSCAADLDGNQIVNGFDLAMLLSAWT